jgi:hypothetical protein
VGKPGDRPAVIDSNELWGLEAQQAIHFDDERAVPEIGKGLPQRVAFLVVDDAG